LDKVHKNTYPSFASCENTLTPDVTSGYISARQKNAVKFLTATLLEVWQGKSAPHLAILYVQYNRSYLTGMLYCNSWTLVKSGVVERRRTGRRASDDKKNFSVAYSICNLSLKNQCFFESHLRIRNAQMYAETC
jgi:hypothetical protein